MASFFNLTLDTLAPQGVTLKINDNAQYTIKTNVTLTIGTTDTPTDGYQMKIWGSAGAATEAAAAWEQYADTKEITLPTGDGIKTISIKIRDDVLNESETVTAQITLDTRLPIVTVTGPDLDRISKMPPSDECKFSIKADKDITEYKVKVVPNEESLENEGTVIPITKGSINMTGSSETGFPAMTAINCTIKGADFQTASGSDGTKIVKVFVKDIAGNWSVA